MPTNIQNKHNCENEDACVPALKEVRKVRQSLEVFPASEVFPFANTLELLDISGNNISSLPEDFSNLKNLRIFFASNNAFTEVPSVLGKCENLEMVGFKACKITRVPEDSLPLKLRWLILTDNAIQTLPAALGDRPRLQKLMLACNQLASLPDMSRCANLQLIRIACNHFPSYTSAIVDSGLAEHPSLVWVALAGNPFTKEAEDAVLAAPPIASIAFEDIKILDLLGEGASGHTYRAKLRNPKQKTKPTHVSEEGNEKDDTDAEVRREKEEKEEEFTDVAVKVFKSAFTSDGTPQSELAAGLAAGEHPNLLTPLAQLVGYPDGKFAMVLPLLSPNISAHNLAGPPSFASCTYDVYAEGTRFSRTVADRILSCIRSALTHLHANGVLHGDVYAHNILYDPATGEAILSDFGAAVLTASLPSHISAKMFALEWRAFEILEKEINERVN